MGVAEILQKRREALAQKNRDEGAAYLAAFVQESDVVVLDSGVAYQVLVLGDGECATLADSIRCHYHGYNVAGEVFDSSKERGVVAEFRLNKLIQAYQQVIPLLPMGTSVKLVSPPEFAYGSEAQSKEIGPESTLIFEIDLLSIV